MKKKGSRKNFVLDTNVILHDSSCIYQFDEHDITIPITVLEELDHFKKGNDSLNFHARAFLRSLDSLSGDKLFNGGVTIGKNAGKISVKMERPMHQDLAVTFDNQKYDHQILNIAYHLMLEDNKREVVLVTKDVNLRMKAKAAGIMAEDYKTDHVKDISSLYKGHRTVEDVPENAFTEMFNGAGGCYVNKLTELIDIIHGEYFILRNNRQSALGVYDATEGIIRRIDKHSAYNIKPRNAEQTFAMNALLDNNIQLITISGKAGTGKTLLALAAALQERKNYRQIFMARPIVPLSNKDIGYLPGDIAAKLDPYMQPLFDNLGVMQMSESDGAKKRIQELLEEEKLVVAPLAYIRGRSLVRTFFIVDEAQNLTPHEVKTIITRAGEGTKIVFTGDVFQIDHPYLDSYSNGLSHLIEKMQGQKLYAHINLEKGERSELAELASNLL